MAVLVDAQDRHAAVLATPLAMGPPHLRGAPVALRVVQAVVRAVVRAHVVAAAPVLAEVVAPNPAVLAVPAHVGVDARRLVLLVAQDHRNLLAVHPAQTHVVVIAQQIVPKIVAVIVRKVAALDVTTDAKIAVKDHVVRPALELVQDAA